MEKLGIFESSIDYFKRFNRDSTSRINSIKANKSLINDFKGLYTFIIFVISSRKKQTVNLNFLSKDGAYNNLCEASVDYGHETYNVFVQTDRTNETAGNYNYVSYSSLYLLVYLVLPLFVFKAIFSSLKFFGFVKEVGFVKCIIRFAIFSSKNFVFSNVMRFCETETVHLVDSYSTNQAINFAAKQRQILVVEIQHGIISKGHIGYNRLNLHNSFYPDKLLLLSKKFVSHVPILQLKNIQYEITNLDYFDKLIVSVNKADKLTVIIGQPSLSSLLLELYDALVSKGGKVLYKPHPRELVKLSENVEIFNEQDFNLNYSYIGGFSTLLLELAESGCPEVIALKDYVPEYYDQVLLDFGISLIKMDKLKNNIASSGLQNEL